MIFNATILAIATPTGSVGGERTYSTEVVAIRCSMAQPTRRQRIEFGSLIADATAVIRIPAQALGLVEVIAGMRLSVKLDGRTARSMDVLKATDTVKRGLNHAAIFASEI